MFVSPSRRVLYGFNAIKVHVTPIITLLFTQVGIEQPLVFLSFQQFMFLSFLKLSSFSLQFSVLYAHSIIRATRTDVNCIGKVQ